MKDLDAWLRGLEELERKARYHLPVSEGGNVFVIMTARDKLGRTALPALREMVQKTDKSLMILSNLPESSPSVKQAVRFLRADLTALIPEDPDAPDPSGS